MTAGPEQNLPGGLYPDCGATLTALSWLEGGWSSELGLGKMPCLALITPFAFNNQFLNSENKFESNVCKVWSTRFEAQRMYGSGQTGLVCHCRQLNQGKNGALLATQLCWFFSSTLPSRGATISLSFYPWKTITTPFLRSLSSLSTWKWEVQLWHAKTCYLLGRFYWNSSQLVLESS